MYKSYEEIDAGTVNYLLSVAGVDKISDISLQDINSYMKGLDDYIYNTETDHG